MTTEKNGTHTRIKDIAKLAGVSAGTVDRVLHGRGKVSEKSAAKVKEAMEQIEYQPNVYASALAMRKQLHYICVLPAHEAGDYWEMVDRGIKRAGKEFQPMHVKITYLYYDQFDRYVCQAVFEQVAGMEADAVLFAPFFREESEVLIAKLEEKGTPYVFLDSKIEGASPLAYFGQDSFRSGAVAARLLLMGLKSDTTVAMFHFIRTGNQGANQTTERKKGFLDYLARHYPDCRCYPVELHATDHEENRMKLEEAFAQHPETSGAVVFNSLTYKVVDYIEQVQHPAIKIIGYDLLEKNRACLQNGQVSFLIAQRPEQQGYLAVKSLSEHLLFNKEVRQMNYMAIDVVMEENLLFN